MTLTHLAARSVTDQSLAMLREAIEGLSDDAIHWVPVATTNSIAILVAHSITATRFWLANGCGNVTSIKAYRQNEREPSFKERAVTTTELLAAIDRFASEASGMLERGTEADLAVAISWRDEGEVEIQPSGTESLIRAIAHLREHVGQAYLLRELWLAQR